MSNSRSSGASREWLPPGWGERGRRWGRGEKCSGSGFEVELGLRSSWREVLAVEPPSTETSSSRGPGHWGRLTPWGPAWVGGIQVEGSEKGPAGDRSPSVAGSEVVFKSMGSVAGAEE